MSIETQLHPNYQTILENHYDSIRIVSFEKEMICNGTSTERRIIREELHRIFRDAENDGVRLYAPDIAQYIDAPKTDCCRTFTYPGPFHSHPDREIFSLIDNMVYHNNIKFPNPRTEVQIQIV
ncbi:MAG: hypothetical protein HeimC2_44070 [Candidatus Heimdallarchaeota archaeon LC_2]|nr:MAG: hypothetical protein HeimC2_44070 [Candidatus Heimdallarchaeota archaeon LC_2]